MPPNSIRAGAEQALVLRVRLIISLHVFCYANRLTMNSTLIGYDAVYCKPTRAKGGCVRCFGAHLGSDTGIVRNCIYG